MKKVLRSIQTLFPNLHEMRFSLMLNLIKITRIPHERDFNALKLFRPDPDQVFIDVGSNRGEAMLSMLTTSKRKNKIIGFEPNPLIFTGLKNYFQRNENVKVYNFGLGDKNHELTLFVPFYRKWMFDGLGSFKYEKAKDWLKDRLWLFNEKKLTIKKIVCQIRKLDDFKLNPYFIKIDVQGFELEVLKGGCKTIEKHKPIFLIESASTEVTRFLEQYGYQFYNFHRGTLVEGSGELNTFCMTPERHAEICFGAKNSSIFVEPAVRAENVLSSRM